MKASRSIKRKIGEVHEKCSDKEIVASKKAAPRIGKQHLTATVKYINASAGENDGTLPVQAANVSCQKLPKGATCSTVAKVDAAAGSQHDFCKKIKLQLFPINKSIRQRLEKDGCNPFLELTLSAQKKISSVIKHLNSKWNSSSLGLGELFLFPYDINAENLASLKQWSLKDANVSAGEVYAAIESPAIFRLRYGWSSDLKFSSSEVADIFPTFGAHSQSRGIKRIFAAAMDTANDKVEGAKLKNEELYKPMSINEHTNVTNNEKTPLNMPVDEIVDVTRKQNVSAKMGTPWDDILTDLSIGGLLSEASLQGKISNSENKNLKPIQSDLSVGGLLSEVSLQGKMSTEMKQENRMELQPSPFTSCLSTGAFLSEASSQGKISGFNLVSKGSKSGLKEISKHGHSVESKFSWDFDLTNLSIGGLLSEASLLMKVKDLDQRSEGKPSSQPSSSFPDSLDAFIAARLKAQPEIPNSSSHEVHSSILDAEETCHAFPVRKISSGNENATTSCGTDAPGNCAEYTSSKSFRVPLSASASERATHAQDQSSQQQRATLFPRSRGIFDEDSSLGLKGIKWEDSLGPFDLGLPILRPVSSGDNVSLSEFVN